MGRTGELYCPRPSPIPYFLYKGSSHVRRIPHWLGGWLLVAVVAASAMAEHAELVRRRAAYESILAKDLKRHIFVLADDTYEGREAGSRGGYAAGNYLTREFARIGLKPAGEQGSYYQGFGAGYRNILGLLPGSDPQLADEIIIVGAHYDHVGYGTPQNSFGPTGYIHNGADDNASGTAALIELAEALVEIGPPRRSILFALWDAEEKGLLGSHHWVAHPTLPLKNVRLVLNMDMLGRLRNNRLEISGSRTSWGLRQLVARHNDQGLEIDFTWAIEDNSDHYPFYARSIAYLMPHTGLHSDYHRPSDDAEKLNVEGIQKATQLLLGIVDEVANADRLPGFRAAARRENVEMQKLWARPLPPLPGRLGVHWNTREANTNGVVVTLVVPGSAAAKAGLKPGDRITAVGEATIATGEDLAKRVLAAPQQTTVTIDRAGQTLKLPLELDGTPIRVGLSWRIDDAEPGTVLVTRVVPYSPAAAAGIKVGDYVHQVSGEKFENEQAFLRLLNTAASPLELTLERNGQLHTVRLEVPSATTPPQAVAPANTEPALPASRQG